MCIKLSPSPGPATWRLCWRQPEFLFASCFCCCVIRSELARTRLRGGHDGGTPSLPRPLHRMPYKASSRVNSKTLWIKHLHNGSCFLNLFEGCLRSSLNSGYHSQNGCVELTTKLLPSVPLGPCPGAPCWSGQGSCRHAKVIDKLKRTCKAFALKEGFQKDVCYSVAVPVPSQSKGSLGVCGGMSNVTKRSRHVYSSVLCRLSSFEGPGCCHGLSPTHAQQQVTSRISKCHSK